MNRSSARPTALLCTLLALAGCGIGGDGGSQPAASTVTVSVAPPAPPPASTAPAGTVPPSVPTSTSASVAPSVEPTADDVDLGDEPPVRYDGVSGSGCSPGADVLPAGWWYGLVYGTPGRNAGFDLACYYAGAAGEQQASIAGEPFFDDYFVVNNSSEIRTISVTSTATASCVYTEPRITDAECTPQQISGDFAVWLRVDQSGDVTRIVEQYAP